MTATDEKMQPCVHARPNWRMCPHCNGVNLISGTRTPGAISPTPTAVNDSSKATSTVNSYASGYRAQPAVEAKCGECDGTGCSMRRKHSSIVDFCPGSTCRSCNGTGLAQAGEGER